MKYVLIVFIGLLSILIGYIAYVLIRLDRYSKKRPSDDEIVSYLNGVGRVLYHFMRVDIEVEGLEKLPDEAFLMTSNHQSNFDPIILQKTGLFLSYIAKIELESSKTARKVMTLVEGLFLPRDDIRASVKVIKDASERLLGGRNIVIFPEGTCSKAKTLGDFKAGSLKVATRVGAPIVPVTITNNYMITRNFPKKTKTKIIIGTPFYKEDYKNKKEVQLIAEIKEKIELNLK